MVCEMTTARGMGSALPKHRRPTGAKPQRGQAMIWMLGMLAASAAVMFALFNTSQTVVGKERTINAADASALAGATAQARLLNLMAYTNRAVIANEVFMVQMLSLESWTQYVARTTDNIGYVVDVASVFFPPLAGLARGLHEAASFADEGHDVLQREVMPLMITVLEGAKKAMAIAHRTLQLGGGLVAENAAKNMAAANRTDFGGRKDDGIQVIDDLGIRGVTFALNEKAWIGFTKQYSDNERTDARQILLDSRDAFTTNRPGSSLVNWRLPTSPVTTIGLHKEGGTRLVAFDRWETEDTLELENRVLRPFRGWRSSYVPIGWGRANADDTGSRGNVWSPRRLAQSWAYSSGGTHDNWSGVPAQFDIADKTKGARETLGFDFLVAVGRPGSHDFTTTTMGINKGSGGPLGSPETPERQASSRNTAFAKARVAFERPQRGLANDITARPLWRDDSAKEYGSLYSPYWQARLADLSPGQKTALLAAVGLTPDYVVYTPGGQTK